MTLKQKKLETLFLHIRTTGFKQSLKEMATGIGVVVLTLVNRYKSRANLEKEVMGFWRQYIIENFETTAFFSNNAVEKLLFFIYELKVSQKRDTHFFNREKENYKKRK